MKGAALCYSFYLNSNFAYLICLLKTRDNAQRGKAKGKTKGATQEEANNSFNRAET